MRTSFLYIFEEDGFGYKKFVLIRERVFLYLNLSKIELVYAVSQASPPSGPGIILEIFEGERAKFQCVVYIYIYNVLI